MRVRVMVSIGKEGILRTCEVPKVHETLIGPTIPAPRVTRTLTSPGPHAVVA